ncbi:MAG: tRNA (N6-isopentenyl adenosine(37)-C2)-methylthiotransferase MiaB [Cytophagales bacterium]|jgi:tRNA-2-methylthio-N6-dimethylallyladenosine synthase|uniref:tRNA (N6-isopentenyl adenosine(37)-C2)-methylthiotransferase MiaB n=1 Tax=Microcystis sp. M112S2 TaxID=2771138 RepID=UPI002587DD81|nr:tRNA (N6-isopentenyl adenosine(37)-C2)-methylthiotransferase MiaB [Microcystis sp. M112S2]MCA2762423.1 tRNA (N6-isopentenyl adenosine(37)-C2)-methylthiotransferase MiaB [Microcystis sp. M151S2]MCA6379152.1 tRNA (N6-isopentenyl adenosine(37)-C2)-methylthiotransferase MiaB [Cytophagales bacterium]MCA2793819.1 tRNA (N6-isopentenyl adenosine(37)-C2)-methylthiotransferase MiaB [Microcystis sp. M112S2]MCA6389477.1 tRNA (N6-isopentenyl adenosine(37)-C2)-methylthiotransferase MiaB [Cytophagales bact
MNKLIENIDFLSPTDAVAKDSIRISLDQNTGKSRKLYIESYGCQMNFSDSEIVASILQKEGFDTTSDINQADLVFLNTCSIREKAEQTVRHRLTHINGLKKKKPALVVGVLGCMAERLKTKLLEEEKIVDLVAGPDAYRDLPQLIGQVDEGDKAVNTFLSREETYADISPVRLNSNGVSAFISIMRGCDNMCSFCVVPFTRGRERSRDPQSIVEEASDLFNRGFREVTLLGQNVDSYKWSEVENNKARLEKKEVDSIVNFANLLELVAKINPDLRVRFSTSHPKDITDEVLYTIAKYENICDYIHLPAQSGNSRILEMMNRGYTREWYLQRVAKIREILGNDCGLSSDMITGFCSENEEEHQDTLSLMELVDYDYSYMFHYSERPGTLAAKKFKDDVPLEVKKRRLDEIIKMQSRLSLRRNLLDIGKTQKVLVEGISKKSTDHLQGRNSANKVVVFPSGNKKKGEYVHVLIESCTGGTLIGKQV